MTKPPKIIESPPLEIIYKPFDEVKLSCIAEGEPVPTYDYCFFTNKHHIFLNNIVYFLIFVLLHWSISVILYTYNAQLIRLRSNGNIQNKGGISNNEVITLF